MPGTDIRTDKSYEGKSINLALSRRGIASLEKIGWTQSNIGMIHRQRKGAVWLISHECLSVCS